MSNAVLRGRRLALHQGAAAFETSAAMLREADPAYPFSLSEADRVDLAGGSVTVSFPGLPVPLRLSLKDEGTGIGQIGFDGSRVSFSGELIGVLRGEDGETGSSVRIDLNGRATPAAVETLLENLRLSDLSRSLTGRTALVTLTDGRGWSRTVPFALHAVDPPHPTPTGPRPPNGLSAGPVGEAFVLPDSDSDGFV